MLLHVKNSPTLCLSMNYNGCPGATCKPAVRFSDPYEVFLKDVVRDERRKAKLSEFFFKLAKNPNLKEGRKGGVSVLFFFFFFF